MRHPLTSALVSIAVVLAWHGRSGLAQDAVDPPKKTIETSPAPDSPTEDSPAKSAKIPRSVLRGQKPDTFLLPNKDGKLQRVLGFHFEDFFEAYKTRHRIGHSQGRPQFTLQRLEASGRAHKDRAELKIELSIGLHTDQWIGIPLGLGQTVLSKPSATIDTTRQFLHFDEAGESYVLWLRGKPAERRMVAFDISVPIARRDDESILQLSTPRAVSSELRLTIDTKSIARVSEGATLLSRSAKDAAGTEFVVQGLGGSFELAWREPGSLALRSTSALNVTGAISMRVDGPTVSPTAVLKVESVGAPFDQFRVRLPAGTKLVDTVASDYTARQIEPDEPGTPTATTQAIVMVQLARKVLGPVDIRLKTERTPEALEADAPIDLAGFDVLGAVRQSGDIAIQVDGPWNVLWEESDPRFEGVRQIEATDLPHDLRYNQPQYAFKYFRQPSRLLTRVIPRKSHLRVDPEYVVFVGARRADLHANLNYFVGGAKAFSFEVDLPDWEIDEIGPPNVVEQWLLLEGKRVVLARLREPLKGNVRLELRAHRKLDGWPEGRSAQRMQFELPTPVAQSHSPATVVIVPDDSVVVEPVTEEMSGLSPQPVTPTVVELPTRQQKPLYFRADTPKAIFSANVTIQPQSIRSEVSAQIVLNEPQATIEQFVKYHVAYEPVEQVTLNLPSELASLDQFEVQIDGEKLNLLEEPATGHIAKQPARVRVGLGRARIGTFTLHVQFPFVIGRLQPQQSVALAVPLVTPADGEITECEVSVTAPNTIHVSPKLADDETASVWESIGRAGDRRVSRHTLRMRTRENVQTVPLVIQRAEPQSASATVVDRLWIQSRITPLARQDRLAMVVQSSPGVVSVQLPAGVPLDRLEVKVNDQIEPFQVVSDHLIEIPLKVETNRSQRIQLRYEFPNLGIPRPYQADFAKLLGNVSVRNVYWQLVLPKEEHLVSAPTFLTAEHAWQWQGYYWARRSHLDQRQLEQWVGAKADTPVPNQTNRYVFSRLGSLESCEFRSASRSFIVLVVSGGALLAGLALVYLPMEQKAGLVLIVTIALLIPAIAYPDPAILISQAAALGVALAMLAATMRRLLHRGTAERVVLRSGGSTVVRPMTAAEAYVASHGDDSASSQTTTIAMAPAPSSISQPSTSPPPTSPPPTSPPSTSQGSDR